VLSVTAFIALLSAQASPPHAERFEYATAVMGTHATIVLYANSQDAAGTAARAAMAALDACDAALSDYRPDSELNQVRRQWSSWTTMSPMLEEGLRGALAVAEASGGAFDPTIGQVVALWRDARAEERPPDPATLGRALASVGWDQFQLCGDRRLRCTSGALTLDLGGVGKGLGAHRAASAACQSGATAALVAVSGDVRAEGCPPGADGWRVAVADGLTEASIVLCLRDQSVSTSGDSEQGAIVDGRRVGHLIDARDGQPLAERRAATAVGACGAIVDAAATALCVCSAAESRLLMTRLPLQAARRVVATPDGSATAAAEVFGTWPDLRAAPSQAGTTVPRDLTEPPHAD